MRSRRSAIEWARIQRTNNAPFGCPGLAAGLVPGILKFRQAAGGAFARAHMVGSALN